MSAEKKAAKILIVDDEKTSLLAFNQVFKHTFNILQANSGEEALEIIKKHPDIAVVVSDQRMPTMTGTELFAKIKSSDPHITRILITGYADLEDAISAINEGTVFKYISKPFDPAKTEKILIEAVDLHR